MPILDKKAASVFAGKVFEAISNSIHAIEEAKEKGCLIGLGKRSGVIVFAVVARFFLTAALPLR
jgi:hypothetical protein